MTHLLSIALALAESGVPVFPCLASKAPACPTGFKAATDDPEAVRKLWHQHPGPLLGVPTGAVSGFDVLDIDPRHEGDLWLEAVRARLPATRTHATRSGGYHLLFRHHAGMKCSANHVAPGVDVRSGGGYVIWWPAAGLPVVDDGQVAEWPPWLLALALPQAPAPLPERPTINLTGTRGERYALGALRNASDRVATAPAGSRNQTLNAQTWNLTRRFKDILGPQRIAETMAVAALAAGLDHKETAATITSALRAGGVE